MLMEVKCDYLLVMTGDGHFVKAQKEERKYTLGETLHFKVYREPKPSIFASTRSLKAGFIAVATFILILSQVFFNPSNEVYAYMEIDIKPSMELSVNDEMEVVDIIPFNEDAQIVLSHMTKWKNQSIEIVAKQIIDICDAKGYMTHREVILTTIIVEENKKSSQKLKKAIAEITIYSETKTHSVVVSREATVEEREMSKDLNVSVGEYLEDLENEEDGKKLNQVVPVKVENSDEGQKGIPAENAEEEKESNVSEDASSLATPKLNPHKPKTSPVESVNEKQNKMTMKELKQSNHSKVSSERRPVSTEVTELETIKFNPKANENSKKTEVLKEKKTELPNVVPDNKKEAKSNGKPLNHEIKELKKTERVNDLPASTDNAKENSNGKANEQNEQKEKQEAGNGNSKENQNSKGNNVKGSENFGDKENKNSKSNGKETSNANRSIHAEVSLLSMVSLEVNVDLEQSFTMTVDESNEVEPVVIELKAETTTQ